MIQLINELTVSYFGWSLRNGRRRLAGCRHLHPIPVATVTAPSAAVAAFTVVDVMNLSAGNHARNEDPEIQGMPNERASERASEVVERYDI